MSYSKTLFFEESGGGGRGRGGFRGGMKNEKKIKDENRVSYFYVQVAQ